MKKIRFDEFVSTEFRNRNWRNPVVQMFLVMLCAISEKKEKRKLENVATRETLILLIFSTLNLEAGASFFRTNNRTIFMIISLLVHSLLKK